MPDCMFRQTGFKKNNFISLTRSMMNLDFQQDLKKLACPVLVICGEKDIANKKASQKLKEQIPYGKITFIKNAGHEVNIDAPKQLGKVLDRFLNDI